MCPGFANIAPQCLQLLDDHGVLITDTRHPVLQRVAETDLVGPDSKPTDEMDRAASIAVPLERQISFKFPTVITPSEQAEDVRHIQTDENGNTEQVLTAKQAATAYAGEVCHECCQIGLDHLLICSAAELCIWGLGFALILLHENIVAFLCLMSWDKSLQAVDGYLSIPVFICSSQSLICDFQHTGGMASAAVAVTPCSSGVEQVMAYTTCGPISATSIKVFVNYSASFPSLQCFLSSLFVHVCWCIADCCMCMTS